jgi:chaperonin GroES
MELKPLGDRVVVERVETEDKTAGGIVLPDTAKEKPQRGTVLAVGEGRITTGGERRQLQVRIGDQILFSSYAGEEFKITDDKRVLLMREDDILAVISSSSAFLPGETTKPAPPPRPRPEPSEPTETTPGRGSDPRAQGSEKHHLGDE